MAETKAQFEVVKEEAAKIKNAAADLEQPINDFTSEVLASIGASGSDAWGGDAAEAAKPILEMIKQDIVDLKALGEDFSSDADSSMAGLEKTSAESTQTINNVYQEH